jgi:hypothetical protein
VTEGTISYTYDATSTMAEANPLRYRGYYYDLMQFLKIVLWNLRIMTGVNIAAMVQ